MIEKKTPPNLRINKHTCIGCKHSIERYEEEAYCKIYTRYTSQTEVCDDWEPEEGKE